MSDIIDTAAATRDSSRSRPASRAVLLWAAIGVVWAVVCVSRDVGWVTGDNFGPASVLGPDVMSNGTLIGLRLVEVISTGVLAVAFYFLAWRPWRRERRVTLDALLLLGGLIGFVMDCWLNTRAPTCRATSRWRVWRWLSADRQERRRRPLV